MKSLCCSIAFAVTCAVSAQADAVIQTTVNGKVTDAVGKFTNSNVITVGGTWHLKNSAFDSNAASPHIPPQTNQGAYTNQDGGDHAELTMETGTELQAKSQAFIGWTTKAWDSDSSFAIVKPVDSPAGKTESATARANVTDPRSFLATFDPGDPLLLDFSLSIAAGSMVETMTGPDMTSSASMSGNYQSSLLTGDLWSFSWSVDSSNPNASVFQFSSNPALGLDDGAIEEAFDALITGANGQFSLSQDFTLTVEIPVTLPPGDTTLSFATSGETDFDAAAATTGVPEPTSLSLFAAGGILIALGRLRKRT